jgi:HEAT repeat protein
MAILVLERCGPDGVEPLVELVAPEHPSKIRAAAATSLGRIGSLAASASSVLCRCLLEEDDTLRNHAVFAIGRLGRDAVADLQRCLASDEESVKKAALEALGRLGSDAREAVPEIRGLADGKDPIMQVACAGCLAQIDPHDPQGLPLLLEATRSPEADIRALAVQRIGELTSEAATAAPELMHCLQDDSAAVRAAAALALARVKPDTVEAVALLTGLLEESIPDVVMNAGIALGTIGPPAADALETLQRLQSHNDPRVSQIAGAAIERISPKS